jgi:hypothetical protein
VRIKPQLTQDLATQIEQEGIEIYAQK